MAYFRQSCLIYVKAILPEGARRDERPRQSEGAIGSTIQLILGHGRVHRLARHSVTWLAKPEYRFKLFNRDRAAAYCHPIVNGLTSWLELDI